MESKCEKYGHDYPFQKPGHFCRRCLKWYGGHVPIIKKKVTVETVTMGRYNDGEPVTEYDVTIRVEFPGTDIPPFELKGNATSYSGNISMVINLDTEGAILDQIEIPSEVNCESGVGDNKKSGMPVFKKWVKDNIDYILSVVRTTYEDRYEQNEVAVIEAEDRIKGMKLEMSKLTPMKDESNKWFE